MNKEIKYGEDIHNKKYNNISAINKYNSIFSNGMGQIKNKKRTLENTRKNSSNIGNIRRRNWAE